MVAGGRIIAALVISLHGIAQGAKGREILAVVMSSRSHVTSISLEDLRRVYLGTKLTLGNNQQVVLTEFAPARPAFYRMVLSLSEDQVRRHWIGVVFAGEKATPPKEFLSLSDFKRFLAETPNTIGFLPAAEVDNSVKVLAIDGLRPGDRGYPLTGKEGTP